MATVINSSNQKPFLIEKRPLLTLKDYLRDDLSSCSSNGFKSFPRRQCCNTVRFLLETDLNNNNNSKQQRRRRIFRRSGSSNAASSTISVLQKASEAFINAVKLLPFPSSSSSVKSASPSSSLQNRSRKGGLLLSRSLSRKLFKKSFWKKADHQREREGNEIRRWRLFREFLDERDKPSDSSDQNTSSAVTTTTSRLSTSSSCNSWTSGSEFTVHSGNAESYSCQNAVVKGQKDLPNEKKVSGGAGVTVGEDSINYSVENTKKWPNEEDKEQFSPVSVLDCPFPDEEEISSPFQRRLVRIEGAKKKLMAKIRTFESLAQIEPVNLEKQIELAELEEESVQSSTQACSSSNKLIEVERNAEKEARKLLKLVKATTSNHLISKADNILLDFFNEKIMENANDSKVLEYKEFMQELKTAQDWLNGQSQEMFLGWEVKDGRHVYIKYMEKNDKWRNFDEEKERLALELEKEVFTSLVNEVLLDLL